jgi:hypothetical protein
LEEDGLARTQSPGLHGGEGEGEEDEETTYTVKAKVFKFTTDREGAPTWSDMGIGAFFHPLALSSLPGLTFISLFVYRHAPSQETQGK